MVGVYFLKTCDDLCGVDKFFYNITGDLQTLWFCCAVCGTSAF